MWSVCVFLHTIWFVWYYSFDNNFRNTDRTCLWNLQNLKYKYDNIFNDNIFIFRFITALLLVKYCISEYWLVNNVGRFLDFYFPIVLLAFSLLLALTRMLIKLFELKWIFIVQVGPIKQINWISYSVMWGIQINVIFSFCMLCVRLKAMWYCQ